MKKIGKIPDGPSWRLHGRAATSAARNKRERIGYDYVHAAVDDHSRLAYVEIHDDQKGPTCAAFLTRAAAFFNTGGITRIERVITGNALACRNSATSSPRSRPWGRNRSSSNPTAAGRTARSNA